jgi:ABC-2 type transport system ATP-binding protein
VQTATRARRVADAPVVVEVRGLEKTFRIPRNRVDSIRERVVQRRGAQEMRELRALHDVSFDVHSGEFFGIVGRNGSGKSTLLKILASIYRVDAGRVRMAGRLAPFIELGVGFNPELTARSNVVLNGVLMGLTRREAQRRLDSVLDFSELRDFVDLKLKNYSSGMMVRLAFAVMVEADADIMLIDEVLAVGDAAFAQKCMDVFERKRRDGRTIVLVTHDMSTVQGFCDRAMLLHDGQVRYLGDPEEAALRYFRLNFGGEASGDALIGVPDVNARLLDVWMEEPDGTRIDSVEQGRPLRFGVLVEARHELADPVFAFHVHAMDDGTVLFGTTHEVDAPGGRVEAGRRIRVVAELENRLLPGRYFLNLWVARSRVQGDVALHTVRVLDFTVFGTRPGPGSLEIRAEVEAVLE